MYYATREESKRLSLRVIIFATRAKRGQENYTEWNRLFTRAAYDTFFPISVERQLKTKKDACNGACEIDYFQSIGAFEIMVRYNYKKRTVSEDTDFKIPIFF